MNTVCPFEGSNAVEAGDCTFSITVSYCILPVSTKTPDTAYDLCLMRFCSKARFSLSSINDNRMFFLVGKHHWNYFPCGWVSHRNGVRDQSKTFSGEQKRNVSFPAWYDGVELPAARAKGLVCYWCKWDSQLSGVGKQHKSPEKHLHNVGLAAHPDPRRRCYCLSSKVTVTGRSWVFFQLDSEISNR